MIVKNFHSFSFESSEIESHYLTKVFMDGKQLHGVTSAEVSFSVDEVPVVKLTFLAGKVSGKIGVSEVSDDG